MASVTIAGDTSGSVTLSAPAVAGSTTLTLPSTSGTVLTTASTTGISGSAISTGTVAEAYGGTGTSTGYYGFKNRIINGAMVIDQRNAGAAVTTTGSYAVDRWFFNNVTDGTLSVQQSTDVPSGSGFKYSLKMTATVGDAAIGAAQYCNLQHRVEGYNFADTGFGASGASTVTLSFWVKATVAGNYSVALYNSAENRINPQQFSVLASNTWEQKTITITGDTSGTWLTTNGIGINITFYPALGSNFLGSSGWNAGGTFGITGQSNAIASNGNIFAITGVQLEKGSTATNFDYRPYGTELALCQRYCFRATSYDLGRAQDTTYPYGVLRLPVTMRASASYTASSGTFTVNSGNAGVVALVFSSVDTAFFYNSSSNWTATAFVQVSATLTAEL